MNELGSILLKGGVTSILLAAMYFVTLVVIIERSLFLYFKRTHADSFQKQLMFSEEKKNIQSFYKNGTFDKYKKSIFYQTAKLLLTSREKNKVHAVRAQAAEGIEDMQSHLWTLPLIIQGGPMLGLLGTVIGLIKCFHQIHLSGGNVDMQILSGGIWEAMLSTAFGLIVGLIAMIGYKSFNHYIESRSNKLNIFLMRLSGISELI